HHPPEGPAQKASVGRLPNIRSVEAVQPERPQTTVGVVGVRMKNPDLSHLCQRVMTKHGLDRLEVVDRDRAVIVEERQEGGTGTCNTGHACGTRAAVRLPDDREVREGSELRPV